MKIDIFYRKVLASDGVQVNICVIFVYSETFIHENSETIDTKHNVDSFNGMCGCQLLPGTFFPFSYYPYNVQICVQLQEMLETALSVTTVKCNVQTRLDTSGNDQLDTQLLYFIMCLLQSSTCFEQRRAHHQEVKLY